MGEDVLVGRITLEDILIEAELLSYYPSFDNKLKLRKPEHMRDVNESDLTELGMSKPEQRRLWKVFNKHFPPTVLGKLKKRVLQRVHSVSGHSDNTSTSLSRAGSANDLAEDQHIIPTSNLVLCKQLGSGEFGSVWQGVWTVSSTNHIKQVAVKCLSPEKMQTNPLEFIQEAAVLHKLSHPCIVRLYGVVLDIKKVMLVSELAPLRSLLECLRQPCLVPSFPVLRLCDFSEQICEGMVYLERNRLIHRDLAARNILVFTANKVKISDFGLSRALGVGEEYYRSNFSVNLKLPIAWCSPECVNFLKFTSASDVWAFGVTLWEMFTYGFQPWAGLNGQQIFAAIDKPQCKRLEQPDACPQEMYSFMLKCWQHEPSNRPRFEDIASLLPEIRPERVQALTECRDGQPDHLQYEKGHLITVLMKRPDQYPDGYFWKGVTEDGKTGLFLPSNTLAYLGENCPKLPTKIEQMTPSTSRASAKNKRLLISSPQGDFRHTGHIGIDGTAFGDVSFIEKSKIQVVNPLPPVSRSVSSSPQPTPRTNGVTYGIIAKQHSNRLESPLINQTTTDGSSGVKDISLGPSLLDEVFEALNTNSDDSPTSLYPHETNDRMKLITTNKKDPKPEALVRPLSHYDVKLLDELKYTAQKYSNKALLEGEVEAARRYYGYESDEDDTRECKNGFIKKWTKSLKHEEPECNRTSFTDVLTKKQASDWTPAAEDAYKSLIECGRDLAEMETAPTSKSERGGSECVSIGSALVNGDVNQSSVNNGLPKFPVNKFEPETVDKIEDEDIHFNPLKQLKQQPARIFVRPNIKSPVVNTRHDNIKVPKIIHKSSFAGRPTSPMNSKGNTAPPIPPKPKQSPAKSEPPLQDDRLNFTCETVEKYSLLDFVLEGINKNDDSNPTTKTSLKNFLGSSEDIINL